MIKYFSLYNLSNHDNKDIELYYSICHMVIEDLILYADLICQVEEQYSCLSEQLYFFKKNLNGLNPLFDVGQITRTDHQTHLEDITFVLIESTRDKGLDLSYRVSLVCEAWKDFFSNLTDIE